MGVPNRICRRVGVAVWVAVSLLACAAAVGAADFRLESVGARGGLSASTTGEDFYQAEAFGNWKLPWGWDLGKEWHLQSRFDLSLGWLGDSGHAAAIGAVGPSVVLGRERLPVSFEGGVSPTLMSRHEFGTKDFGSEFQFTSHVGVNWDLAAHWRLSYRFQHMSNAGLASKNPGLNMHLFGISYLF